MTFASHPIHSLIDCPARKYLSCKRHNITIYSHKYICKDHNVTIYSYKSLSNYHSIMIFCIKITTSWYTGCLETLPVYTGVPNRYAEIFGPKWRNLVNMVQSELNMSFSPRLSGWPKVVQQCSPQALLKKSSWQHFFGHPVFRQYLSKPRDIASWYIAIITHLDRDCAAFELLIMKCA